MSTEKIQLIEENGMLYTPIDAVQDKLMKSYWGESGSDKVLLAERIASDDVIVGRFPLRNRQDRINLSIVLFGARETGQIPDVDSVLLPNGEEFTVADL
jgi:hypothetical protein